MSADYKQTIENLQNELTHVRQVESLKFKFCKQWVENCRNGLFWDSYLKSYNYNKIAIYGTDEFGLMLYQELCKTDIEIVCFIDKKAEELVQIYGIPVITIHNLLEYSNNIDTIVVTPVNIYEEVIGDVFKIIPEMAVISLQDALYEFQEADNG